MSLFTSTPTLTTERLFLERFVAGDAKSLKSAIDDPRILDQLCGLPRPYLLTDAEAWASGDFDRVQRGTFAWVIRTHNDSGIIGSLGLHAVAWPGSAEIGYWLKPEFWGQGMMVEAAEAVLDFGFKKLQYSRIYARHLMANQASGRVMQKLGMTKEGVQRHGMRQMDGVVDLTVYAICDDDWQGESDYVKPLETERLLIRSAYNADESSLLALEQDDQLQSSLGRRFHARSWLRSSRSMLLQGYRRYVVVEKATRAPVGFCTVNPALPGVATVGYGLAPHVRGKGLATEMVKAVVEWIFLNLDLIRVDAYTFVGNDASERVLVKSDFQFGALRENSFLKDGRPQSVKNWFRLRADGL